MDCKDILESQRGRPTAAVLLLTDGITTEGKIDQRGGALRAAQGHPAVHSRGR